MRKDGSYLDFEHVTLGSLVFVEENHFKYVGRTGNWESYELKAGEIWMVVLLLGRPRLAVLKNMRNAETVRLRVNDLLELDDKDVVTVGPA